VKARASSEAAVLIAPRLLAQAIRYPKSGQIDASNAAGASRDIELRVGLSISPIDTLRGVSVLRVGDADCTQHELGEAIEVLLRQDTSSAQLKARRAEATYLASRRPEWLELLGKADVRLKARLITVTEMHELRRLADELERRSAQVHADLLTLEAKTEGPKPPRVAVSPKRYAESVDQLEREASHLRTFDAWSFRLTGGAVPDPGRSGRSVDWFGFAEIGYSLGGVPQTSAESRYLEARREELSASPQELPRKLGVFRRLLAAQRTGSELELGVVEAQLGRIRATLDALEGFDSPDAVQSRARLVLESISVEADAIFLRRTLRELGQLLEQTQ
jgi:hypothetical protein